jgi:SAM-dependent methyltransferase
MSGEQPWHPYVFDTERRRFVGDFEEMYRAERDEGFDSWHQLDPSRLDTQVAALLAERVPFRTAVDLGCGKGGFADTLARGGAQITGVDLSQTAIDLAQENMPQHTWIAAPARDYVQGLTEPIDLIVIRELLSYLEDWRALIADCAAKTKWLLVGLYVPPDPIGFVKSHAELQAELDRHFEPLETIDLPLRRITTWLVQRPGTPERPASP